MPINKKNRFLNIYLFFIVFLYSVFLVYYNISKRIKHAHLSNHTDFGVLEVIKNISLKDSGPFLLVLLFLIIPISIKFIKSSDTQIAKSLKDRFYKMKSNNIVKYQIAIDQCTTEPDLKSIVRICYNEALAFKPIFLTIPTKAFFMILLSFNEKFRGSRSVIQDIIIGCITFILFLTITLFFKKYFKTRKIIWQVLFNSFFMTLIFSSFATFFYLIIMP